MNKKKIQTSSFRLFVYIWTASIDHFFDIVDTNVGADCFDCQLFVDANCQLLTPHHPAIVNVSKCSIIYFLLKEY